MQDVDNSACDGRSSYSYRRSWTSRCYYSYSGYAGEGTTSTENRVLSRYSNGSGGFCFFVTFSNDENSSSWTCEGFRILPR